MLRTVECCFCECRKTNKTMGFKGDKWREIFAHLIDLKYFKKEASPRISAAIRSVVGYMLCHLDSLIFVAIMNIYEVSEYVAL